MNIQLSDRIVQLEKGFSKGQRLIARYIMEHYDTAAFMTASKLGKVVGVSESTVVRFAVEIGYSGYPELQQAMQEMIRNRLTSVQRLEHTAAGYKIEDLLDATLDQDIDIIKRTKEVLSHEQFYAAADAVTKARKIFILGAGSSLALATFLHHYMDLITGEAVLINATSEAQILQQMVNLTEEDAVIGISFPRYSKKAVTAIKYAADRGAATIAITDSPIAPIAAAAKYTLQARSDMVSFVDSLVAPLSVINALIVVSAISRKDEVAKTLQSLEKIWDQYGTYEKVESK